MGNVTKDFGIRLKFLREAAEFTQGQLAEKLNVSRGAISYYENGDRTPDIEFLDSVSSLFGVTLDFLMGYTVNWNDSYSFMSESFGLSDKACSALEHGSVGEIISQILGDDNFPIIEHLLFEVRYKAANETLLNYVSFLLSDYISNCILSKFTLDSKKDNQAIIEKKDTAFKNLKKAQEHFFDLSFDDDEYNLMLNNPKIFQSEPDEPSELDIARTERSLNDPDVLMRKKVHKKIEEYFG